jgi:hypothetical protein
VAGRRRPRATTSHRAHTRRSTSSPRPACSTRTATSRGWSADVQLDPEQLERSRVAITIDAASIDTRVERRDNPPAQRRLPRRRPAPTITFVSKAITRTSPTAGVIAGELTMRGVTRPVEVPVTLVFYENGRGRFAGSSPSGAAMIRACLQLAHEPDRRRGAGAVQPERDGAEGSEARPACAGRPRRRGGSGRPPTQKASRATVPSASRAR